MFNPRHFGSSRQHCQRPIGKVMVLPSGFRFIVRISLHFSALPRSLSWYVYATTLNSDARSFVLNPSEHLARDGIPSGDESLELPHLRSFDGLCESLEMLRRLVRKQGPTNTVPPILIRIAEGPHPQPRPCFFRVSASYPPLARSLPNHPSMKLAYDSSSSVFFHLTSAHWMDTPTAIDSAHPLRRASVCHH
jgi:hypothetical protein